MVKLLMHLLIVSVAVASFASSAGTIGVGFEVYKAGKFAYGGMKKYRNSIEAYQAAQEFARLLGFESIAAAA